MGNSVREGRPGRRAESGGLDTTISHTISTKDTK